MNFRLNSQTVLMDAPHKTEPLYPLQLSTPRKHVHAEKNVNSFHQLQNQRIIPEETSNDQSCSVLRGASIGAVSSFNLRTPVVHTYTGCPTVH